MRWSSGERCLGRAGKGSVGVEQGKQCLGGAGEALGGR